jgi:hypothetical protein
MPLISISIIGFLILWIVFWIIPDEDGEQLNGLWRATEEFDDGTKAIFDMEIKCKNGIVKGTHHSVSGMDKGTTYKISGTYNKDNILNFLWTQKQKSKLESGTVSAKLINDGFLEGKGCFREPRDQKIHPSTFMAIKESDKKIIKEINKDSNSKERIK